MTLDISMSEHTKFYAIKGKDTLTLKAIIPKNANKTGKSYNPKYNKKYGYMYFKNDFNKKCLDNFITNIVPGISKKIKSPKTKVSMEIEGKFNTIKHMFQDQTNLPKSDYGILGLQVKYTPAKWVTDITGDKWDPKFNPIKESRGTWKFSKNAVSSATNDKIAWFLHDKNKWKSFYGSLGYDSKNDKLIKPHKWNKFCSNDQFKSATVGWARHARFIYKDLQANQIIFFDPWKKNVSKTQAFKKMSAHIQKKYGYTTKFTNGKPDQSNEGSCTTQALLRALMVAEYGLPGATMEVPNDYAVFTSRLTSKFRK